PGLTVLTLPVNPRYGSAVPLAVPTPEKRFGESYEYMKKGFREKASGPLRASRFGYTICLFPAGGDVLPIPTAQGIKAPFVFSTRDPGPPMPHPSPSPPGPAPPPRWKKLGWKGWALGGAIVALLALVHFQGGFLPPAEPPDPAVRRFAPSAAPFAAFKD